MAQTVKNPLAVQETWVRSLGWEDSLEKGMAPTPAFLPGESLWTEEPGGLQSMGHNESDMTKELSTAQHRRDQVLQPRCLKGQAAC